MTTPAMSLMRSEMPFSRRIILGGVSLLLIFLLSWFLLTIHYWLGMPFFFISLFVFISFYVKPYQARNLFLLLTFTLFTFMVVSSLSYGIIVTYPDNFPFIQTNLTDQLSAAILIGASAALFTVILFLLTVAIAAFGILKWHNKDQSISYGAAFSHLLTGVLGIFQLSVKVIDGELVGSDRDLERLKTIGGPGWLTVFPGYMVALHEWGQITRIVGLGSTPLKREEQVKAILPLNPKGDVNTIENVMTQDRIPLTVSVLHVAQMEPVADTETRLQQALSQAEDRLATLQSEGASDTEIKAARTNVESARQKLQALESDSKIGDDYNQAYTTIAKLAATKSPDVWAGLKGPITSNIKDVFMSVNFDDLFQLAEGEDNGAIEIRTDSRRIAAIENLVKEKSTGSGPGKGLALRVVDISEIQFPEELQQAINEEAYSLIKSRIRRLEANTKAETEEIEANIRVRKADAERQAKVTEAQGEESAAQFKAQAQLTLAQAKAQAQLELARVKAQARILHGEAEGQAQAASSGHKAGAQLELARAKAQGIILQGQAEGEAQAALYREILRELRQEELLSQQEITNAALQLVTATVSVKELKSFLKATVRSQYINPRVEEDPDNSEE